MLFINLLSLIGLTLWDFRFTLPLVKPSVAVHDGYESQSEHDTKRGKSSEFFFTLHIAHEFSYFVLLANV